MSRFFTCGGSPVREIREPFVKEDGSIEVRVTGKENFNDYIQSFRDSCDVELLVKRAVNGDESALNQRVPMYGDFTQMPKTYADMLQRVIDAQRFFESLDPDVRAGFNNDFQQFLSQSMDKEVLEKVGLLKVEKESEEISES